MLDLKSIILARKMFGSSGGSSGGDSTSKTRALIDRSITKVFGTDTTIVGRFAFHTCSKLATIDLSSVGTIGFYAFYGCTSLKSLILRSTTLITLDSKAFHNSSIASGTGYIYVPDNLVSSYKSATNWSTYSAQIRSIEDYPDICGGDE